MHAAHVEKSPRLQRVLELLRGRGARGATTMEIVQIAHVCAVNSIVAELRENRFEIVCKFDQRTEDGESVYRYFLVDTHEGVQTASHHAPPIREIEAGSPGAEAVRARDGIGEVRSRGQGPHDARTTARHDTALPGHLPTVQQDLFGRAM